MSNMEELPNLKQYKQQLEDFLVILERMKTNNLGADEILWAELSIQKTIKAIENQ